MNILRLITKTRKQLFWCGTGFILIIFAFVITIHAGRHGLNGPLSALPDPKQALAVPFFDMFVFAPLFGLFIDWLPFETSLGEMTLGEYRKHNPEGFFGHYLMMVGALGGAACTAKGRKMSNYENAVGTGQLHMWFDVAARGGQRLTNV